MQKASRAWDAGTQSQTPGTCVKVQKAKTSREKQELCVCSMEKETQSWAALLYSQPSTDTEAAS